MIEKIIKRYRESGNFIVISASAGTGKTHTITKRELEHLFNKRSLDFLAITFTNQTAREMKERLVNYLIDLSVIREMKEIQREDLTDIYKSLNISSPVQAEEILLLIFRWYSTLNIGTIDSLAVRLLRAYQDRTGIIVEPKILLDENDFYNKLISNFIQRELLSGLPDDDAINWSKNILKQISGDLLKMDPIGAISQEVQSIRGYMLNNGVDLRSITVSSETNTIDGIAEEIRKIYERIKDLDEKYHGYINKTTINSINKEINSRRPKIIKIRINKDGNRDQDFLSEKNKIEKKLKECVEEKKYCLLCEAEEHIEIAKFLSKLEKAINRDMKNQPEIPLSEIYQILISSIVEPEGIALRMGRRFSLILVDEFQDTSLLQLRLLAKVFDDVLIKDGNIIVVGDTKQGIYGFRNADYRIMSNIINNKKKGLENLRKNFRSAENILKFIGKLFPTEERIEQYVDTLNFRKDDLSLDKKVYYEAFKRTGLYNQHNIEGDRKDDGGYVEIRTYGIDLDKIREKISEDREYPEDIFDSLDLESLFPDIYDIIRDATSKRGLSFRDIAILLRSNEEVRALSAYLSKAKVTFKSFSSTDARERPISREIISIMKTIYNDRDTLSLNIFLRGDLFHNRVTRDHLISEYDYNILINSLSSASAVDRSTNHTVIETIKDRYPKVYEECLRDLFDSGVYLGAYELLLNIYRIFKVPEFYNEEQAAYMRLLDAAIQIEKEEDSSIATYIQRFEDQTIKEFESESMWTMDIPESVDAVTISTVHKMKGKEFPIVIYVCKRQSEQRQPKYMVCPIGGKDYLIRPGSEFIKNQSYTDPEMKVVEEKMIEDLIQYAANTINAHYVAITRAKNEIYILLYNRGKKGTRCILTSMLYNFLGNNATTTTKERGNKCSIYRIGRKIEGKAVRDTAENSEILKVEIPLQRIEYCRSYLLRDEITDYGLQVHAVLEQIEYCEDEDIAACVNNAIKELERRGIAIDNRGRLMEDVRRIFLDPKMRWAFVRKEGRRIFREKEFVDENGNLMRMDRIVIDPEWVHVIDYKTGLPSENEIREYKRQVSDYRAFLGKYYKRQTSGYIFLISKGEVIKL